MPAALLGRQQAAVIKCQLYYGEVEIRLAEPQTLVLDMLLYLLFYGLRTNVKSHSCY